MATDNNDLSAALSSLSLRPSSPSSTSSSPAKSTFVLACSDGKDVVVDVDVLISSSGVFKDMLETGTGEERCEVSESSREIKELVDLLMGGRLPMVEEKWLGVFSMHDKYDIPSLSVPLPVDAGYGFVPLDFRKRVIDHAVGLFSKLKLSNNHHSHFPSDGYSYTSAWKKAEHEVKQRLKPSSNPADLMRYELFEKPDPPNVCQTCLPRLAKKLRGLDLRWNKYGTGKRAVKLIPLNKRYDPSSRL
ncbi:hypothetical protein JCM8547_003080 [Rhodosporidiobolus lusitaniae]